MGQLQGLISSGRVEFDENSENGLVINDKYIPEEVLNQILLYTDSKTLLNCQLVCKRWHSSLQTYVWKKKAEAVIGRLLQFDTQMPWFFYYVICSKKSMEKNLIKNHSGKDGLKKHWRIRSEGGDLWKIECPPLGAPVMPLSDPVFEGKQYCFVTSYGSCSKEQTVDLIAEGMLPQILDNIQPPITISEWYCCRWDCPAIYECSAKLIDKDAKVLDTFAFRDSLEEEKQNIWLHVEHEFTNYGPGLRKVVFYHGGMDRSFWAGHYGSKMAGACVKVNLPKSYKPTKKPSVPLLGQSSTHVLNAESAESLENDH
ncbi:F-box only protein 6-like isoform X2 [Athalia rosae]|nr:F-box only protein 6-like isoform X2 [Athalia rosae]